MRSAFGSLSHLGVQPPLHAVVAWATRGQSGCMRRQVHSPLAARAAAADADATGGAGNANNEDGAYYSVLLDADNAPMPMLQRRGSSLLDLCKNEQWSELVDELTRSSQVMACCGGC